MAELRLGLVGCGRIAERGYVPALRSVPRLRLVAVADPDADRRERIAPGVPGFASALALLDAVALDALVIASPPTAHVADAIAAAAAGVRALVEKPAAPDTAGAARLAALEPAPFVAFNRRFQAGTERLRQLCAGQAGLELDLQLDTELAAWASYLVRDEPLLDLGPHLVDLARWLAGAEISRIRTLELSASAAVLELEAGAARARIACANNRRWRELVVARAQGRELGRLRAGGLTGRLRARLGASPDALVTSLAAQLQAFAEAVAGEPLGSLATAADGLRTLLALDAARASADAGGAWRDVAAAVAQNA